MNEIGAFNPQVMAENIRRVNDMLKTAVSGEIDLGNRMLRASVTARVEGLGENLDVLG
jgi:hypothetical protein